MFARTGRPLLPRSAVVSHAKCLRMNGRFRVALIAIGTGKVPELPVTCPALLSRPDPRRSTDSRR